MDSESPSLQTLIHDYLEEVEIRGRSSLTAANYGRQLATFLRWLAQTTGREERALQPRHITEELLRLYLLFLARRRDPHTKHTIRTTTRNLYLIALRNLFRYCRRRKFNVPDPEDHLVLAKERDAEIRHLLRSEAERIAAAVQLDSPTGPRDRAIIEALFGTGCRVSELVSVKIRQLNLRTREAEVIGKGGRSRLVFFTDTAAHWIRRYLETRKDSSPFLFVSNRRGDDGELRPLSVRQVQHRIARAAQRAGLPFRVSPHWFRHSRLTIIATRLGVHAAQRIAGHASLTTTAKYVHGDQRELRRGFDEAERIDRGDQEPSTLRPP